MGAAESPIDFLRVSHRQSNWLELEVGLYDRMSDFEIEELELLRILFPTNRKGKIAFFCPTAGLNANFGALPAELTVLGYDVVWLFGNVDSYLASTESNKFLVINDMCRRLRGLDVIITASVMDCLPKDVIKVLHDHLSYAPFVLESKVKSLASDPTRCNRIYKSRRELFSELSAFVAYLPLYDLILTPSEPITQISETVLRLHGYSDSQETRNSRKFLKEESIANVVELAAYRNGLQIVQSGYCKLDVPIRKYSGLKPEKLFVYAPTHADSFGSTDDPIWGLALAGVEDANHILSFLCRSFPDYTVVYKPFKDDLKSPKLQAVCKTLFKSYQNFVLDESGSEYWALYSRCALMISDFSSTAYTFALGLGRPVLFYSPSEASLPKEILESTYCRSRLSIGLVVAAIDELIPTTRRILSNYEEFTSKVESFRRKNLVEPGNASKYAADAIENLVNGPTEINSRKLLPYSRSFFRSPDYTNAGSDATF